MLSLSLATLMAASMFGADPTPREIRGTELIVESELEELEAPPGDVQYVPSAKLAAAFPGYLFVVANFLNTPAEDLPSALKARNLYAVSPDGTAKLLATPEDVLELFQTAFRPIKSADDAKKAAEAALGLEEAKYPEQEFKTKPESLSATPSKKGGYEAAAASEPAPAAPGGPPSGMGPISVNFSIGAKGRPGSVTTVNNYQPPPRRRRAVTPADIAGDQPAAQQAAGGPVTNINSPTINKSLPGNTFFTPTPSPKGGGGKKRSPIIAIGQDGKPRTFDTLVGLGAFVRQQFGPVKTKQQAKDIAETYLTLATGVFPSYKWDTVKDSDIIVTDSGKGIEVVGKVFVKNDPNKWIMMDWRFGRRGHATSVQRATSGLKRD